MCRKPESSVIYLPRVERWEPEPDVCGEAAAYVAGGRVLDIVVTPLANGLVEADVVEDRVLARGWFLTVPEAKSAAVDAARRVIKLGRVA